jgi:four helix bundle protein
LIILGMLLSDFEEILSWQKAQDLSYEIYKLLSSLRDFSFRDQIQRASVSISNNIAE